MQKIWKGEQIQEERQEKEEPPFPLESHAEISMTPRNQKKKAKKSAEASCSSNHVLVRCLLEPLIKPLATDIKLSLDSSAAMSILYFLVQPYL